MLLLISEKYNKKDFGLYRDDGLRVVKNKSGTETEKIKKNIQKIFKENKLDTVIQCNMKIVSYLDVSLNLSNSNYSPNIHPTFSNKSPHLLKHEFPTYLPTKPYLTNQKKNTKKL